MPITHHTHFDAAGEANPHTIVLLHGLCCTRTYWRLQVEALSSAYHLLMPDLPGHGSRWHEPFSLDRAVQQLHALIQQQAHGPVLLVGHSLGGYLAQRYIAAHPEATCAVVLQDCTAKTRSLLLLPYQLYAGICIVMPDPLLCGIETALGSLRFLPKASAALRQGGLYHDCVPQAIHELRNTAFLPPLAHYEKPTLILNGTNDFIFRQDETRYCRTLPNARLQIIPNARHTSNLDQPAAFNQAVLAFAQSISW